MVVIVGHLGKRLRLAAQRAQIVITLPDHILTYLGT
jgi:hypothetical protein